MSKGGGRGGGGGTSSGRTGGAAGLPSPDSAQKGGFSTYSQADVARNGGWEPTTHNGTRMGVRMSMRNRTSLASVGDNVTVGRAVFGSQTTGTITGISKTRTPGSSTGPRMVAVATPLGHVITSSEFLW